MKLLNCENFFNGKPIDEQSRFAFHCNGREWSQDSRFEAESHVEV